MEILKINGVSKNYSNGRGVHNISLSIQDGQIFGFLGPNGSGKTTTLKIIMKMLNRDSGEIEINGFNIDEQFESAMRCVGSMFESTVHYGELTAYENMRQLSRYYPEVHKVRIDELLTLVGLYQNRGEKVKRFSLGMRQRLAIAQAMYGKPKLLILDEPFNGLDIEGVVEIRNAIVNMAQYDRTTFMISSHMAAEMEKMCTHVGVIRDGVLIKTDSVDAIMALYPTLEDFFMALTKDPVQESIEN